MTHAAQLIKAAIDLGAELLLTGCGRIRFSGPDTPELRAGGIPLTVEPQLDSDGRDTKTTRNRRQRFATGSVGLKPRYELRASLHEKKAS